MVKRMMSLTYSGNIVRQHDPDRFLLSLLTRPRVRPALWALFAFNYEIAKTREVVSERTIGLIRLQWWREAVAEIYASKKTGKAVRKHEGVEALAEAIHAYDLPREDFERLIHAREFDLEGQAPATKAAFLDYCDETTTPLFRLALKIINESIHESVLKNISVEYARIGLLRAVSYMRSSRFVMLPQDILEKYNLSAQKMCDFNEAENISKVIKELLVEENQLRNVQISSMAAPKSRFLKGARKMAALYKAQIEAVHYDVFDPRLSIPPRFMALRVWGAPLF